MSMRGGRQGGTVSRRRGGEEGYCEQEGGVGRRDNVSRRRGGEEGTVSRREGWKAGNWISSASAAARTERAFPGFNVTSVPKAQ